MLQACRAADDRTRARWPHNWCAWFRLRICATWLRFLEGACSIAGKVGQANASAYCASKFAVRGLTQSAGERLLNVSVIGIILNVFIYLLALELGKHGITVNAYAPGPIDTTFRALVPLHHRLVSHDVSCDNSLVNLEQLGASTNSIPDRPETRKVHGQKA